MASMVADFLYMQSLLHIKGVCAIIEKNERKLCREIAGSKWFQELKHDKQCGVDSRNSREKIEEEKRNFFETWLALLSHDKLCGVESRSKIKIKKIL